MIEQTTAPKKSLKLEVRHDDTSIAIQTKDTSLLDFGVVALIVAGIVVTVYLVKRAWK